MWLFPKFYLRFLFTLMVRLQTEPTGPGFVDTYDSVTNRTYRTWVSTEPTGPGFERLMFLVVRSGAFIFRARRRRFHLLTRRFYQK